MSMTIPCLDRSHATCNQVRLFEVLPNFIGTKSVTHFQDDGLHK